MNSFDLFCMKMYIFQHRNSGLYDLWTKGLISEYVSGFFLSNLILEKGSTWMVYNWQPLQKPKTKFQSTMCWSDIFEIVKTASVPFSLQPRTSVKCPLCSSCHQLCILLPLKHSWQRYATVKDIQSGLCQMGHLSSCQCTRWHYSSQHTVSWPQRINT